MRLWQWEPRVLERLWCAENRSLAAVKIEITMVLYVFFGLNALFYSIILVWFLVLITDFSRSFKICLLAGLVQLNLKSRLTPFQFAVLSELRRDMEVPWSLNDEMFEIRCRYIDTSAKDAPNIFTYSLYQSGASLSHLNVMVFSRFASFFFAFFSKVRSHWLRHAVYHPDAQQGICHWKSGTTTAKVGLESGVPWKKQWSTGKIQTFLCFVSVFRNAVWVKQSWMICSWYSICWICLICIQECICIWQLFGFMYVCTYALMPAPHTHTNIHIYSSTHMNDKYPLWYYLFTVTYLCIIRKDVLQVCLVYIPCAANPLFVVFCGHKGRPRPSERNVNSKKA